MTMLWKSRGTLRTEAEGNAATVVCGVVAEEPGSCSYCLDCLVQIKPRRYISCREQWDTPKNFKLAMQMNRQSELSICFNQKWLC
jgi:hypothetical protein